VGEDGSGREIIKGQSDEGRGEERGRQGGKEGRKERKRT